MKWVMYTDTPGLDRFPHAKRFWVWRSAAKRLMRTDPEFRKRVRRFQITMVGNALLLAALAQAHRFIPVSVLIAVTVVYCFYALRASLQIQAFQNERVAKVLADCIA